MPGSFMKNFTPLKKEILLESFDKAKAIIDEQFIWFVYNNDQPIAFLVMFPDANQIFKKLNGKLHFWNKLRFLYYRKKKMINRTPYYHYGRCSRIPRNLGLNLEFSGT